MAEEDSRAADEQAAAAAMAVTPGGAAVSGALAAFDNVNFIVDGKPSGQGSGGFTLSREEAQAMLEEARGITEDLGQLAEEAKMLTHTRAPADDPVSLEFNRVGVEAFRKGAVHVAAERDYWLSLVRALEKALGIVAEADEQAGREITKSAGEDASGGGYV